MIGRLLFLLYLWFSVNVVLVHGINVTEDHSVQTRVIGEVCQSADILFSTEHFDQLRNCSVIEGYLKITDIRFNDSIFDGLEFPLLTEVTDFIVFYRVQGLTSLGKLFPNLRVIRGNFLLYDEYSFIVYEMPDLQEIGLKSLFEISRGSVRIERNPQLCSGDTIKWSRIVSRTDRTLNFVCNKRPMNSCRACSHAGNSINDNNVDPLERSELNFKSLCWNRSHCQKICPSQCGNSTCNSKGDCCDELCLGCDETGKCLTCRHLYNVNTKDPQCVKYCPPNKFSYKSRRCVTEIECRTMGTSFISQVGVQYEFIPHDGVCSTDCPSNFYPFGPRGNRKCIPCIGMSTKICEGRSIHDITSAQQYRGCTHVLGSLIISIRDRRGRGNAIVSELEKCLSDIEVIEGHLVIRGSNQLVSLRFFKKLRLVNNKPLVTEEYGIKVIGNENLQELFKQNVVIEHGRMFFHFNPKLCMTVIEEFKSDVVDLRNESSFSNNEVSPDTNGYKAACEIAGLHVENNPESSRCVGTCRKECPPGYIYGTLTAQRYRGCTHINGQLVINIRNGGPNTVRELEDSLANVEVIEGNLIVMASYPLVSLGFFKKLRIVRNNCSTGKEWYGIEVLENGNLEALFLHNVTIERGGMSFHLNPKLCMQVIEELKHNVVELRNISKLSIEDVAPNTNGNEVACQIKELNVEVSSIGPFWALLDITTIQYEDHRVLLGYLIHYKPSAYRNVTMFDDLNACGGDGWQVEEIVDFDRRATRMQYVVTNLTPDTQYAYFIRTSTIESEIIGGSSMINYFRTGPPAPIPMVTTGGGSAETSCHSESPEFDSVSADGVEEWNSFDDDLKIFAYYKRKPVITGEPTEINYFDQCF